MNRVRKLRKSHFLLGFAIMFIVACSEGFGELSVPQVMENQKNDSKSELLDKLGHEGIDALDEVDGIIKLITNVGDWDAAYLTKYGYFCYDKDLMNNPDAVYLALAFLSADGKDISCLISTKEEVKPTQLVTNEGIYYFSYPNDSILELLYDTGEKITMLDSIAYSSSDLSGMLLFNEGDPLKAVLANFVALLDDSPSIGIDTPETNKLREYRTTCSDVMALSYTSVAETDLSLAKSESGKYAFSETVMEWYGDEIGEYVCNILSLWTGKATYKVGGSSCTLSATIWCPSKNYNEYGEYGIICDSEESNLYVGRAEYEDKGYQTEADLSYSVDFRGLKPNTTYYYRAYYKFHGSDHGNITPKYGNSSDQIIYDPTIKSFRTGENNLTVDVVMCIDVTGSMSDIINTVKSNAIGFYNLFEQLCAEKEIELNALNAQVVAFRDKNVDGNWLETSPTYSLPAQQEQYNSFVNGLYADGGGDTPESGLEALQTAFNKTDWGKDDGYHRQVVILWTDAPYLTGSYSSVSLTSLNTQWNSMPSGRRLILFAPYGTDSNGGSWGDLDGWKNLIHETDLSSGFNNFEYILESIIGELTSKAKSRESRVSSQANTRFRSN